MKSIKVSSFWLLFISLWLFSACNTAKRAAREAPEGSADFLLKTLVSNQVNAQWFSARAKIDFADGSTSMGGTANIRMIKDSLIWVSVRKLGFEVARAKITKDSIYLIDRISNAYDIKDLSYLQKTYNVPADLSTLQAIILGNPFFFTKKLQSERAEAGYHLFGNGGGMDTHYWLDKKTFQLQKMQFKDEREQREVQMQLQDYQQVAQNQKFSYFRILEMNSRDTGKVKVELKYSQLEINIPKDVHFEIPARYTRTSY